MNNEDAKKLIVRINFLNKVYAALFIASLLMLAAMWFLIGRTLAAYCVWIFLLGGAVLVRAYRASLATKLVSMKHMD
jgi:hypothetical protein